jgi:ELWxxDGT repeat protein
VANINAGAADSYPSEFTALGDWLYFSALDATTGQELWRTNGTSTTRVADINPTGTDGSYPYGFARLGDYIYFNAGDGTTTKLRRVSAAGVVESSSPAGTNVFFGCMCEHPVITFDGRLFAPAYSDETGFEFASLDEPTFGLPGTNRDGSAWSTTLVLIAGALAVAGVGLRKGQLAK